MKLYKRLFIRLVCVISLILSMISAPVAAADTNSVTAATSATVKQGNSAYCYVNIDSTEGLASLDVTVHYDPAKVKITGVYNSISCTLYDSVINTDNIQFSYIMDGQGKATKTRLFYFQYQVLNNADVGDAYFDITVGEAYDSSLNEMVVSGSRCKFTIAETISNKSCSIYGSSQVTTSVEQEFTLSYQFSTYQIACGTAVITYDSELFEIVEVKNGAFLTDKVVDINTDLTGEIYISFVGTEYYSNTNFVSVTFRTIKNVTDTSKIVLKTMELLDKELNPISCNGYTTNTSVIYDNTYIGDAPAMKLDGNFSYKDKQIILEVLLEENSHLGAGDFIINFNPEVVTYNSCTKGFSPSFFYINDKNVGSGELKFHIISLSDIVTEEKILTVIFDVKAPYDCEKTYFSLEGTGLTNSLTEEILLNFVDTSVQIEYEVLNGLHRAKDGNWYYYSNGKVDTSYTGMAENSYGIWYIKKGKLDRTYTGMLVYAGKWIYVNKGKFDTTYTGMAMNTAGWWYMKNGVLDRTYTGMAKNSYGTWYMKNGKLDRSYTGMMLYNSKWIYVNKGKFDITYTGMAMNTAGWWYMKNGMLDRTYTGMSENSYGTWYMKNGKLDRTYTGMMLYNGKWIYVNKGKFDITYTGLAKNSVGWWYMKNGVLDRTYTGIAMNQYGKWYIKNGKLISKYNV